MLFLNDFHFLEIILLSRLLKLISILLLLFSLLFVVIINDVIPEIAFHIFYCALQVNHDSFDFHFCDLVFVF